jgi:hypothetical protein
MPPIARVALFRAKSILTVQQNMLWLKILTLLTAAAGGVIALFGETRSKHRLTRLGKFSLVLMATGLVAATAVEIADYKGKSLTKEWELTRHQPIYELKLIFHYNKPTSVESELSSKVVYERKKKVAYS